MALVQWCCGFCGLLFLRCKARKKITTKDNHFRVPINKKRHLVPDFLSISKITVDLFREQGKPRFTFHERLFFAMPQCENNWVPR